MKIFAKKSLGQHFLNSKHILEQIISAAEIKQGETVLEIGPGTGILTEKLIESGANVVTIEKDARVESDLRTKFKTAIESSALYLAIADVLETDIARLGLENGRYALIANIPYYITGAILEKFLEHEPRPNRLVLLVQREVAERILARDDKESILSISIKAFGKPSIVAKVPKGAFTPPPTVESAILAINDVSDANFRAENIDISHFFAILKAGFAHKRKFLIRNLEDVVAKDRIEKIWTDLQLDKKVRAEDIPKDIWLKIAKMAQNVNN